MAVSLDDCQTSLFGKGSKIEEKIKRCYRHKENIELKDIEYQTHYERNCFFQYHEFELSKVIQLYQK